MNEADVIEICRRAIVTLLVVAGPIMALTLAVGLVISVFQSVTQIQEMTLTFVPKMILVFTAAIFLMPYMLSHLISFMQGIADLMIGLGTG